MLPAPLPRIIQGGMGAGVSSPALARAVSAAGQLGVVSGTGLDLLLARRLQRGDPDGSIRRSLERLPLPGVAERVLARWFVRGGLPAGEPFRPKPLPGLLPPRELLELIVAANFVEMDLAREGHDRPVGINYLEKIQVPTLPSLFGAMLAGAAVVFMGAGLPRAIPGVLDRLASGRPVELALEIRGESSGDAARLRFDPAQFCGGRAPELARPAFVPIVSSSVLAGALVRKTTGRIDGFVLEGPSAGGHVAPPRRRERLVSGATDATDATDATERHGGWDEASLEAMRRLGLPFWLAGSQATPEALAAALAAGAAGVQVGTAFAFCEESALREDLKARVLELSRQGRAVALTEPLASPTGFPFQVVPLEGSASDEGVAEARRRRCDLGYLREAYRRPNGAIGWRCPAEDVAEHLRKGGSRQATRGRRCLCNALLANVGLGQLREDGSSEPALVTAGTEVAQVARFLAPGAASYPARAVLDRLLSVAGQGDS